GKGPLVAALRHGSGALERRPLAAPYSAASFSFFRARVLIFTEAGFAANMRSTPVNGSLPMRFFLAGTFCTVTFSRPGSVKEPRPFLLTDMTIAPSSAASTALVDFASTPDCSATCVARLDLLNAVLIGFSAAGAAFTGALTAFAALAGAAAFLVVLAGAAALTAFLTTGA